MQKNKGTLYIILAILFLYGGGCALDYQAKKDDIKQYCNFVDLHRKNPKLGWPDYREIYSGECKKDKDYR